MLRGNESRRPEVWDRHLLAALFLDFFRSWLRHAEPFRCPRAQRGRGAILQAGNRQAVGSGRSPPLQSTGALGSQTILLDWRRAHWIMESRGVRAAGFQLL